MEELGIRDLINTIRRRKVVIITTTVIAVMLGIIISFAPNPTESEEQKELYKSVSSIVIPNLSAVGDVTTKDVTILNQQIVKTYEAVANSRTIAHDTIEKLNLDLTIDEFMQKLKIAVNKDAQIITIYYIDENESIPQDVLKSYIDNFSKEGERIYPTIKLKVLDSPSKSEVISKETIDKLSGNYTEGENSLNDNTTHKAKNKKMILVLSLLGGLMGGIVISVIIEYVGNDIKKKEEVEKILQLDTLAIIPNNKGKEKFKIKEAFRILRANLQLTSDKVITITSASEKDGKTKVSVNLAQTLAEGGFRTLLIDGNGRNPKIHELLSVENNNGISEILQNNKIKDIQSFVSSTNNENLNILLWGNEKNNVPDLLKKTELIEALNEIKNKFDYIIIDTTSMVDYSDGQIFAQVSDTTLIVASEGKTNRKDMFRLEEIIKISNINVRGVIWINSKF